MYVLFLFTKSQISNLTIQISNIDVSKVVRSITGSFEEFERTAVSTAISSWFMFGIVSSAETVYGVMMNPDDYIAAIFSLKTTCLP